MSHRRYNLLFLCTGNSARSLMAEAILEREAPDRFKSYSAGSKPKSAPHPYTIALLRGLGHDTRFARSKSWDEFAGPDAPRMDIVITVCDSAAAEVCPIWPGAPISAHWGLPDPAAATGNEAEKRLAFAEAYQTLRDRISTLTSLPLATFDRIMLRDRLNAIGRDDAPSRSPVTSTPA